VATTDPCTAVEISARNGARLSACPHGGHVLAWTPAGGAERLWLSRDAGCGPGAAIRGGVPVIWPQFAGRGPLPKHGFARDRGWETLHAGTDDEGAASVAFALADDERTRALWPHRFRLTLAARAAGAELDIRLTVRNESPDVAEFTGALHPYLRVGDVARVTVSGLAGCPAEDNLTGATRTVPAGPFAFRGPVDLAVRDVPGPVVVDDPVLGRLTGLAAGFPDRVGWNPGAGRAPGDVHPGGEAEFVCVEPAAVSPVRLGPGATWTGRQVLRAG
jgi:glucose-6-phosphate 1-epimerase